MCSSKDMIVSCINYDKYGLYKIVGIRKMIYSEVKDKTADVTFFFLLHLEEPGANVNYFLLYNCLSMSTR